MKDNENKIDQITIDFIVEELAKIAVMNFDEILENYTCDFSKQKDGDYAMVYIRHDIILQLKKEGDEILMIPSVIIVDNEMNYTFYTLPYWGEQQ
jgi:hypothetical protein